MEKYDRVAIRGDSGLVVQGLPIPLIVIARTNPNNPMQDLMLVWHLTPFLIARAHRTRNEWTTMHVVVRPDMPDGDVRNLGVHLRSESMPLTAFELVRQALLMYRDYEAGNMSTDAPPIITPRELAEAINCERSLVQKMETAVEVLRENEYFLSRQVSDTLASDVAQILRDYPDDLTRLIEQAVREKLSVREAKRLAREIKTERTASIQLVTSKASPAIPNPVEDDTEALKMAEIAIMLRGYVQRCGYFDVRDLEEFIPTLNTIAHRLSTLP
jgi:hypothetical protein